MLGKLRRDCRPLQRLGYKHSKSENCFYASLTRAVTVHRPSLKAPLLIASAM